MHAGYPHPASHIMSLDASLLSSNIEAAWEQSQSHHALRANHHQLEPFNFGYSAAFPQYTLSPTLSSASSSTSSASPSSASSSGGLYPGAGVGGAGTGAGAGDYMTMLRKSRMHFNNNPDLVPPEPTCLPTHQLFEFDFPPTPSSPATSSNIPTPPLRSQVPQTLSFSSVSPVAGSVPSSSSSSPVSVASGSTVSKPSSPTTGSAAKRTTTTTTASTAKKPRTCVSTKDFVPPDVTGLSKREARLVKNRAAAFLSRQRKREEFELMEIRVAELEQENQRMQALLDGRTPPPDTPSSSSTSSVSAQKELEDLRSQLAAARQRERELNEQIEQLQSTTTSQQQHVKTESQEPALSASSSDDGSSSGASTPLLTPTSSFPLSLRANPKSGASLGLMVLLCALPSLLSSNNSNGTNNGLPTASDFSSLPVTAAAAAASTGTSSGDWDLEWSRLHKSTASSMDVDSSSEAHAPSSFSSPSDRKWTKLELTSDDSELAAAGLGALDISFDTSKSNDGKILVRVHSRSSSSSSPSSSSSSSSAPSLHKSSSISNSVSLALPHSLTFNPTDSDSDSDPLGPFLGMNMGTIGINALNAFGSSMSGFGHNSALGIPEFPEFAQDFESTSPVVVTQQHQRQHGCDSDGVRDGLRRRVRIALKSAPAPGGEGGEWEVELR